MDNNPAKSHSNNNQGYSQLSQDIKQLHLKSFFDRSLSKEDQLFFDALISDYINRGRIYNSRMSKNVQW